MKNSRVAAVMFAVSNVFALSQLFAQTNASSQLANASVVARPAGIASAKFYRTEGTVAEARELQVGEVRLIDSLKWSREFGLGKAPREPFADGKRRSTWLAPVASLILPGSGQAILRQQRSLGFLLAEAFLVIQTMGVQDDLDKAAKQYQAIAADVARFQFGTDRPPGNWDYYEHMASQSINSSGAYDLNIGGRFTPETDETTYNGRQWLLARGLYWSNPSQAPAENSSEYQQALAYYSERAVQGSFRWTWRDNQNAKELYIQTIAEANRTRQEGISLRGLIVANHLLSLVDSYITVRLRRYGGAGLVGASIKSELRPVGIPGQSLVATRINVSLPIPRSAYGR